MKMLYLPETYKANFWKAGSEDYLGCFLVFLFILLLLLLVGCFFASAAALNHKEKLSCIYGEGNQTGVSSNAISIGLCIINGMIK